MSHYTILTLAISFTVLFNYLYSRTYLVNELTLTLRKDNELTVEDLSLLCDLFYLPYEHGGQGLQLLQEFNWLKSNAHLVIAANQTKEKSKPEVL